MMILSVWLVFLTTWFIILTIKYMDLKQSFNYQEDRLKEVSNRDYKKIYELTNRLMMLEQKLGLEYKHHYAYHSYEEKKK